MGIVKLLAEGNQIPEEYNPHPLKGNWKNYMECHIENDTLLIWFDEENDAIELVRLGSHSELFGKGRKRCPCSHPVAPCGPIPQNMARALMPRQPYSVAVLSTGGRLHPRFLRKRGLGRKWSSLWLKGDGGIRKNSFF